MPTPRVETNSPYYKPETPTTDSFQKTHPLITEVLQTLGKAPVIKIFIPQSFKAEDITKPVALTEKQYQDLADKEYHLPAEQTRLKAPLGMKMERHATHIQEKDVEKMERDVRIIDGELDQIPLAARKAGYGYALETERRHLLQALPADKRSELILQRTREVVLRHVNEGNISTLIKDVTTLEHKASDFPHMKKELLEIQNFAKSAISYQSDLQTRGAAVSKERIANKLELFRVEAHKRIQQKNLPEITAFADKMEKQLPEVMAFDKGLYRDFLGLLSELRREEAFLKLESSVRPPVPPHVEPPQKKEEVAPAPEIEADPIAEITVIASGNLEKPAVIATEIEPEVDPESYLAEIEAFAGDYLDKPAFIATEVDPESYLAEIEAFSRDNLEKPESKALNPELEAYLTAFETPPAVNVEKTKNVPFEPIVQSPLVMEALHVEVAAGAILEKLPSLQEIEEASLPQEVSADVAKLLSLADAVSGPSNTNKKLRIDPRSNELKLMERSRLGQGHAGKVSGAALEQLLRETKKNSADPQIHQVVMRLTNSDWVQEVCNNNSSLSKELDGLYKGHFDAITKELQMELERAKSASTEEIEILFQAAQTHIKNAPTQEKQYNEMGNLFDEVRKLTAKAGSGRIEDDNVLARARELRREVEKEMDSYHLKNAKDFVTNSYKQYVSLSLYGADNAKLIQRNFAAPFQEVETALMNENHPLQPGEKLNENFLEGYSKITAAKETIEKMVKELDDAGNKDPIAYTKIASQRNDQMGLYFKYQTKLYLAVLPQVADQSPALQERALALQSKLTDAMKEVKKNPQHLVANMDWDSINEEMKSILREQERTSSQYSAWDEIKKNCYPAGSKQLSQTRDVGKGYFTISKDQRDIRFAFMNKGGIELTFPVQRTADGFKVTWRYDPLEEIKSEQIFKTLLDFEEACQQKFFPQSQIKFSILGNE